MTCSVGRTGRTLSTTPSRTRTQYRDNLLQRFCENDFDRVKLPTGLRKKNCEQTLDCYSGYSISARLTSRNQPKFVCSSCFMSHYQQVSWFTIRRMAMILALGGTASASVTWSETTGAGARGRSSVSSRAMVGGAHQITSDCSFHSYLQSIPSGLGPEMEGC